jgi:hypothetical protein
MANLDPHRQVLELGGARLEFTPPLPPLWLSLAAQPRLAPGPASLCLALLALASPAWEGVKQGAGDGASPRHDAEGLAALPAGLLPRLLPLLCPPWLSEDEEAELAQLERHLRAGVDFPGLDCAACAEQERRGEGSPDCAACPRPRPPATAQAALGLAPLLELAPARAWSWLEGLPPRERWLLAWRLALVRRWRPGPGGGRCPFAGGRANMGPE